MSTFARDLMAHDVLTIPADMPFEEIQHLFVVANVYGAPVVDGEGAVVGIISAIDLLRVADEAADEDVDEGESDERTTSQTAAQIASREVVWVSPSTSVARVAQLMLSEGIHRVLVGDGGRLEGILTTFDLLRAVQ